MHMCIWVENTFVVTVLSGKFRYFNCHYRSFASPTLPHTNNLKHKFYYATHTKLKRYKKCGRRESGCPCGVCGYGLKWREREATGCWQCCFSGRVLVTRVCAACEFLLGRCNWCLTDGHRSCCDLCYHQ